MSDKIKPLKEKNSTVSEESLNLKPKKELKPYYVKITVEQQKQFETTKNAIAEHKRYTEATVDAAYGNGVYTYQDFMDSTGLSRATVGRSLSKLYDDGWIDKKTTISPSGAESIEYALLLQKASVAERLNRPGFVS